MKYSIWAPRVDSLCVAFEDDHRVALSQAERGHHSADFEIPVNRRYGLIADGNGPFPDPRADYLPDGVHGSSLRWDHSYAFETEDFSPVPLSDAIIYEMHVGTFSEDGTFLGAIEHLGHLVDLGVTHLELLPICAFPGRRGWGYDGVAPFAPHATYGTPDDLKKLIDEAHARGLAVLLDVVLNHLGPDGNYLGLYAPYFTDRYKTPWGKAVNLDGPDSDLVRCAFVDCALHWLETYRFDGLRLDAVHALHDQSAVHFLEQLSSAVKTTSERLGRALPLIGECDLNDPRYVRPPAEGGLGLDAQWCDDFHHALHAFFSGERDGYYEDYGSLAHLAKALEQGYVFDGTWSPHRRRFHGRPPVGVRPDQLVVFSQNHDQVGNRARGDRLSTLVAHPRLFQAAALTLLSPFVPLLFQGEEWGTKRPFLYFTDHQDETLARAVTEGRRREFSYFSEHHGKVPDPQDPATFQQSVLDWKEKGAGLHLQLLDWHRTLIALRRKSSALAREGPKTSVSFDQDENWLVLRRGELLAFFNFSDRPQAVPGYSDGLEVAASHPEDVKPSEEIPAHATVIAWGPECHDGRHGGELA